MVATTILDQAQAACEIATYLGEPGRRSVVIEGPTASGKTALSRAAAGLLRRKFTERIACGDRLDRAVEELPLELRLSRTTRKDVAEFVADAAEDLGDVLTEGSIPFGKLANRALVRVLVGGARGPLTEVQQRFLSRLLTLPPGKRPLLVADDLQYWDPVSLRFLRRMLQGDLDPFYGRLRRAGVILLVDRSRANGGNREQLEAVLGVAHGLSVHVDYAPLSKYAAVLRLLGMEATLPKEEVQTLRLLTGGNLALTQLVVDEIRQMETRPDRTSDESAATYFQGVLARRLAMEDLRGEMGSVVRLLTAAGDQMRLDELACALKCSPEEARDRAGVTAAKFEFVSLADDRLRISHETLQPLLSAALGQDGPAAHRVLAACLARLRPGDYGRRAAHLAAADDIAAARQYALLDRLAGVRQGRYAWSASGAGSAKGLNNHFDAALDDAMAALSGGKVEGAIARLDGVEAEAPIPLRWELTLMRAKLLIGLSDDTKVERGLGLLEELDEAQGTEIELWGRAKELQIVALSNLRRTDEGRRLEGVLRQVYQARAGFDPAAQLAINRLRRSSEAIHAPQVAHDRLQTALRFFAPERQNGLPAYPGEYLATLSNLCANELLLGRFASARSHARRTTQLDFELVEFVLRRPELVWSNVLLCELYNGGPPGRIADAFLGLAPNPDPTVLDDMLLEINISAAQAAAGRLAEAHARLARAYETFRSCGGRFQPYGAHFASANLATLSWLLGRDAETAERLAEAETALAAMGEEYAAPFLAARLAVLDPVLRNRPLARTREMLEAPLMGPPRVGESWRFFARAVLGTDIQFWSEL